MNRDTLNEHCYAVIELMLFWRCRRVSAFICCLNRSGYSAVKIVADLCMNHPGYTPELNAYVIRRLHEFEREEDLKL